MGRRHARDDESLSELRFGLRPGVAAERTSPEVWLNRLLDHFLALGGTEDGRRTLLASADAVVTTICRAIEHGCPERALQLVQVVEPVLKEATRWGAWRRTLEAGLTAARALGDVEAEAWLMHELDVRAQAMG